MNGVELYNSNMQKINILKKQSLYLVGALCALVASYIIANDGYTVTLGEPQLLPPSAQADVPVGDSGAGGGDCGDKGGGGGCSS